MVCEELIVRWGKWQIDLTKCEMYEAVGALLARQVTLAIQLARAPAIWNGHIAPLILRTMADNYITLAWIFKDPLDRSRKFILYGLGQEKLQIEHRKRQPQNADNDRIIEAKEKWLNSQKYSFLTEINIGSWSGIDTRKMAEQAKCLDTYRFTYMPFSASTHSMWHHVSRYNLVYCPNPLHQCHRVPYVPLEVEIDIDYLYRAVKYVKKVFDLFDAKTKIESYPPSAYDKFVASIEKLNKEEEENRKTAEDTTPENNGTG